MANVVGIDLGTTYSVVAHLDQTGRADVLRDEDGNNLTPSAILFEGDKHSIVGWEAHREASVTRSKVAMEFKREMGSDAPFDPHSMNPTELSALVLKKLSGIHGMGIKRSV